jgi:NADPH:quinone reductase-like Zn-dependent oxidoreductase
LGFEEAAAVPIAATTALQGLRDKGRIREGQNVLIHGASGSVGTFAVQIAKSFGASVTAVCSKRNMDNARTLGADEVVDYESQDFTKRGQKYDLILGVNGYHSVLGFRGALSPKGTYVLIGSSKVIRALLQTVTLGTLLSKIGDRKIKFMIADVTQADLTFLKDLLEARRIIPSIDRSFAFAELSEAFRYLGEGHARGKITINMRKS